MNKVNFESRVSAAERYHTFLSNSKNLPWLALYKECEGNSNFGLPESMVLLHPNWHSELQISKVNDPRGHASFPSASGNAKCRSIEIWGYECPYIGSEIHIDHTFPFSRGGSTKSDNAMYLCKEHNLSKSTDLHMIPWETFNTKNWIREEIGYLINMAKRFYNKELFFPDKFLQQ